MSAHPTDQTLVGSWQLVRWRMTTQGAEILPYTDRAEGVLTYTLDGYMSAFLHHPDWRIVDEINAANHLLFGAYAGRWSLLGSSVQHHVAFSSAPSTIGTTLVRVIKRHTSRQLTLASERQLGSPQHILDWRRLGQPRLDNDT